MLLFLIINNIRIIFNVDVNEKNWLTKLDVMMDLFEIVAYVNVNVINHFMVENI